MYSVNVLLYWTGWRYVPVTYFYEYGDLIFLFHKRSFGKFSNCKLMKDDLAPWNF